MARWLLYLFRGRVVARVVTYPGSLARASHPAIRAHIRDDRLLRPHAETAGELPGIRVLSWDLGLLHARAWVAAVPRRRYSRTQGYTFIPPRDLSEYRVAQALAFLDPELDAGP
jgi:hypothetical protein